jgi:hypothetical protein
MTLMAEQEKLEDVIQEAIDRAGSQSRLAEIVTKNCGDTVWPSQISNMRKGMTLRDRRVPDGLLTVWPDLAARMYVAMGIKPTGAPPTMDEEFERIADQRGIPMHEVLSTILDEEIRRLSKRRGKK